MADAERGRKGDDGGGLFTTPQKKNNTGEISFLHKIEIVAHQIPCSLVKGSEPIRLLCNLFVYWSIRASGKMNRIQKERSSDRQHQTLQNPESRSFRILKTTKGHFCVATFLCVVMSAMFYALMYLVAGLPSREYQRTVVANSSCLDGSPAVFYRREPNINTFTGIVHLQGGGWCDTNARST